MPSPDRPVDLPHTWRPFGARMMGSVLGAMLLIVCVAFWVLVGEDVRSRFTTFQIGTVIAMSLLAFSVWFALMRCRITVTATDVTVVNGYTLRSYEWSQVVAVNLRRGAPWAGLDLSDGTSISVMAIQGSDGPRAREAVRNIRHFIKTQTAETPDD